MINTNWGFFHRTDILLLSAMRMHHYNWTDFRDDSDEQTNKYNKIDLSDTTIDVTLLNYTQWVCCCNISTQPSEYFFIVYVISDDS